MFYCNQKGALKDYLSVGCAMQSCSVKSPFTPPTINNGQWYFCVCFYS